MAAHLPPVGNPITTKLLDRPVETLSAAFSGFDVYAYRSGTMALAASLVAAVALAREKGLKGDPEVLLPAYACPDLISAAVYAGVKPVLVDFEVDRPWMSLEMLQQLFSEQTVAVIAVHFLGIPERLERIRAVMGERDVLLIEDSAQYFPCGEVKPSYWRGDLVVLSFGRGKPVSLLGGGAVLCRKDNSTGKLAQRLARILPLAKEATLSFVGTGVGPGLSWRLKIALYRQLLRPHLYGLLQSLPFLSIGETRYQPLAAITAAEPGMETLLAANIKQYQQRERQQQAWVAAIISHSGSEFIDLPVVCGHIEGEPLLRYPVLLSSIGLKAQLLAAMHAKGLGASGMYPVILPQIPGVSTLLVGRGRFPHAERFAGSILTLPIHAGVKRSHIDNMGGVIKAFWVE